MVPLAMIEKWPPCFAKRAGFVLSKYAAATVSRDAAGSICIHNMGMSRLVILPRGKGGEKRDTRAVRHAKSDALMFGSSQADVFRTPAYDCRALGSDRKPEFASTRVRSGPRDMEQAPGRQPKWLGRPPPTDSSSSSSPSAFPGVWARRCGCQSSRNSRPDRRWFHCGRPRTCP
jgi:hypothetical protein